MPDGVDWGLALRPWSWFGNSYTCTYPYEGSSWAMLTAYRSGGVENEHWIYTNNVNDTRCLKDWIYYDADGTTVVANIQGRATTARDPKRWCALPVFRTPGVEGKQWASCRCRVKQ